MEALFLEEIDTQIKYFKDQLAIETDENMQIYLSGLLLMLTNTRQTFVNKFVITEASGNAEIFERSV